jgi:AbiV family abortive infection protein
MRSSKESKSEYGEIARLAYVNAMDLYDEARFLLKEKKSPRAFALAVASCEELVKSYLCDTVWKESLDPRTLLVERKGKKWPILTDHLNKHGLFALFLFLGEVRKGGRKSLEETIKSLKTTLALDFRSVNGGAEMETFVRAMEGRREDSLYVDVKPVKGRIRTPKEEITPEICRGLMKRIEEFTPLLEANLQLSRDEYQEEIRKSRSLTGRKRADD